MYRELYLRPFSFVGSWFISILTKLGSQGEVEVGFLR